MESGREPVENHISITDRYKLALIFRLIQQSYFVTDGAFSALSANKGCAVNCSVLPVEITFDGSYLIQLFLGSQKVRV